MNYYLVWSKETGKLIARGSAKECAKMMGRTTAKGFRAMTLSIAHKKHYHIQTLPEQGRTVCPCWTCSELPDGITYQPGIVSQSCGKARCTKHEQWMQEYMNRLREKFAPEK